MDDETVIDSFVGLVTFSHLIDFEWLLSACIHSLVVNFDDSCLKVPPPGILICHLRNLWVINSSGNFMILVGRGGAVGVVGLFQEPVR